MDELTMTGTAKLGGSCKSVSVAPGQRKGRGGVEQVILPVERRFGLWGTNPDRFTDAAQGLVLVGLPIGFITRLEARLAETEEALFRLVHSIDEPNNNHISLKPSSQRKDDRIREWDSLPLKNVDEIRAWYRSRSEQTHSPPQHDTLMDEDQGARPIHTTPPESETVDFPDDTGDGQGETVMLQDADDAVMPRNDIHIQEESGGSKAKEMEQKHPNMYF
ncbi:hypothetical protein FMUND_9208 [Fusarium mundagurra]|uniref:Uncharacterized protein n=1 Tax=Fusarium mundagurra TaxID=1567541 RepID=A0A8H6DB83_9HYPO|nr:hypothetical protein FMUND_9208 [Fusarium mundagurra]